MKLAPLTTPHRIALGVSLLLLIAGLGGYTLLKVLDNAKRAAFLSDAVVPQAELSGNMLTALNKAQLANRTYAILHQRSDREQGIKHMEEFSKYYAAAVKLSAEYPDLTTLKALLPEIEKNHVAYMTQVKATEDQTDRLNKIIEQFNLNGPITLSALNDLATDQDKKMQQEIASRLGAEKIEERRQKIFFTNDLLSRINVIRESVFKAYSQQKPELLDTIPPFFHEIDSLIQKLRPILHDPVNKQQLDVIETKVAFYKAGVAELAQNLSAGHAINGFRVAAGAELDSLLQRLDLKATERTLEYTNSSRNGLSWAGKFLIGGVIGMVLLGIGAVFHLIRGSNKHS